jgi:hypothetical protein
MYSYKAWEFFLRVFNLADTNKTSPVYLSFPVQNL